MHDLLPYYESLVAEREEMLRDLSLTQQEELEVGAFSPTPSKKGRLDVKETEEGLFELHLKYDK